MTMSSSLFLRHIKQSAYLAEYFCDVAVVAVENYLGLSPVLDLLEDGPVVAIRGLQPPYRDAHSGLGWGLK